MELQTDSFDSHDLDHQREHGYQEFNFRKQKRKETNKVMQLNFEVNTRKICKSRKPND